MSPANASPDAEYITGWSLGILVLALGLSIFIVALDTTIVSTAIPSITKEFHSLDSQGWYGSAFFLTTGATQAPWGKIYRFFSLKSTFITSMVIFEGGSLICALANGSAMLIAGRAIAGVGASGVVSGAYTILAVSSAPRIRGSLVAVFGVNYAIASFVGPLLGGVFTTKATWRWCFWINLPIGGLTAIAIIFIFTASASQRPEPATWISIFKQVDLVGVVLLASTTLCYLLALEWGGAVKPWSDPDVVGTLVGFGVIGLLFCVWEWYMGDDAMIPRSLFFKRHVFGNCGFTFFLGAAFFVVLYYLPLYFQIVQGLSATASGIRTLPIVVACGLFAALSGIYLSVCGYPLPAMFLGSAAGAVAHGLFCTLDQDTSLAFIIGVQILAGVGIGVCCQMPIIINQSIVEPSAISSVTAMTLFFELYGGALFLQLAQSLFSNKVSAYLDHHDISHSHTNHLRSLGRRGSESGAGTLEIAPEAFLSGIQTAFILATVLAGMAAAFSLFSGLSTYKKPADEE